MLTFVCDQCGAKGAAARPGAARCTACGHVAFVEAPAGRRPPSDADPFATAMARPERGGRDLSEETVAPTERFATLWVRPGVQDGLTPSPPFPIPPPRRRGLRRAATAGALVVAGAALAWVAGAIGSRWTGADRAAEVRAASTPAAPVVRPAAVATPPVATPVVATPPTHPRPSPRAAPADAARPAPKRTLAAASEHAAGSRIALVNPAPVDRQCVPRALRARHDVADRLPVEIAVRLRVAASGEIGKIDVLDATDSEVAEAVGDAVRSCPFSPGTDEEGRPVALPIVMRIRFASREATAGF